MSFLALAAPIVVGVALGLHFSRLLAALVRDLGGSEAVVKLYREIFVFCLTGVVGTGVCGYLVGQDPALCYVLGYGLGSCVGYFFPCLPPKLTRESVRTVVLMSEALKESVPDTENRILLILNTLERPKSIQRSEGWSSKELAERIEKASDEASDKLTR